MASWREPLKGQAKRWLYRLGWDPQRFDSLGSQAGTMRRLLDAHRIDLVFDVGANAGQYGLFLRELGYRGRIVSFEPLGSVHAQLVSAARGDPDWVVAPQMALGDVDGEANINVSANLASSSLLGALPSLRATAPAADYQSVERVPVRRLDAVGPEYLHGAMRPLLKLDVQGFEDRVLLGARDLLLAVWGVQCELSLVALYDDQVLWRELTDRLESAGFALHAIFPVFSDPRCGRLLQVDSVFFREG